MFSFHKPEPLKVKTIKFSLDGNFRDNAWLFKISKIGAAI